MWLLLGLSVPIFYIIGLISSVRWLARRGHPASIQTRQLVGQQLRQWAASFTTDLPKRKVVEEAADRVEHDFFPSSAPSWVDMLPDTAETRLSHGQEVHTSGRSTMPVKAAAGPHWTQKNVSLAFQDLDNINLLLFLGAFLVVASAGLFVGYNFSELSGAFKTGFLGLFTALFYIGGLVLYLTLPRLRLAGTAFTGIGLVLAPLVGGAAYNFVYFRQHGPMVWLLTSLSMMVLYGVAQELTRQSYIVYFVALATLSMFEAGVSLIGLPVYWMAWVMSLVGLIFLSSTQYRSLRHNLGTPLRVSANIMLPISVLMSLLLINEFGRSQLGITLGLAGIFYARLATLDANRREGLAYFGLALALLPAALTFGLWDSFPRHQLALILLLVALMYQLVGRLQPTIERQWSEMIAVLAGSLAMIAVILSFGEPLAMAFCLALAAAINAELAMRLRLSTLALFATLSLMIWPYVAIMQLLQPAGGWGAVTAAYLVLALVMVVWRQELRGWPDHGEAVGVAGYLTAMGLALLAAVQAGYLEMTLAGLVVAGLLVGVSFLEERTELVYLAAASAYVAAFGIVGLVSSSQVSRTVAFALAGLAMFAVGWFMPDTPRARVLRLAALPGPFFGAYLSVIYGEDSLLPIISQLVAATLLWLEAIRERRLMIQEVAIGIAIWGVQWLMIHDGYSQLQLFTVPWAAFVGYLAYRRRHRGRDHFDGLVGLALAILTLPLATQALDINGHWYALAQVVEGLALIAAGMVYKYKLVTAWGVAVLVGEVLYQLRDVIYALPKYVISASLGVLLLAVATVLLLRRHGE